MTPGYAKPRSELPWLPYGETDRVIINSHNFTPVWTPAVNGKMPVAAWVPSRDTAGNGTTTLTDLIGGSNGTLTNMDAATDWVADTDAGGVRAIQTDGTAEWIALGDFGPLPVSGGLSLWTRPDSVYVAANQNLFGTNGFASNSRGFRLERSSNGVSNLLVGNDTGSFPSSANIFGLGTIAADAWTHIVIAWNTSTNRITAWTNGTVRVNNATNSFWVSNLSDLRLGIGFNTLRGYGGKHDDIRLFNVSIDATDVTDLYAAGLGRGVQA